MSGYKFIRRNRNKFGHGTAFYITDQLPSRTIKIENPSGTEILTIEITIRGGSRTAATSKMEHFVIIVNCCKPLTIITKRLLKETINKELL